MQRPALPHSSVQFRSVAQSRLNLCDPWAACSTPGFPVHYQVPESAQTHVHQVDDAIQPPQLLLSPFPPAFDLSQYQGLFQWVGSLHQWPKYWSFIFSMSPSSEYSGLISFRIGLQSRGLSRVFSNTTVQKHQFFGTQLSSWFNSHIHACLIDKSWIDGPFSAK